MAKLLETRLPTAVDEVDPQTFNRMGRILELNLGTFDPTSTPQYTDTEQNQNQFNAGDVVWNTSSGSLELYDGNKWHEIYAPSRNGVGATGSIGTVTIVTNGATAIEI